MQRRIIMAITALSFVAAAGAALGYRTIHTDQDEQVTLAQCPAVVQATIAAHLAGGTLVEIERTTDHGEVLFEVDVRGAGGIFEFNVAENGAFRGMEADDEEDDDGDEDGGEDGDITVTFAQCPLVVRLTILDWVGNGDINEIELSPAGSYEVDATGAQGQFEFVVAGDGTYLGSEDEDEDDEDGD